MIEPVLSDEALLADIAAANRLDGGFRLWWLGQSGFLLQYQESHWLFDPYLSDSLTAKYADSDRPHLRMTRCPIAPEKLSMVRVVTSSHHHTDHLDGPTLRGIIAANEQVRIVAPRAHQHLVSERTGRAVDQIDWIDAHHSLNIDDFRVHAITAAHDLPETDVNGQWIHLGYVVRFGPWTVYHSGDCVPHDGLAEQLGEYAIDVAILPINGTAPSRRVSGNFWGDEAAALGKAIGARLVIPCHYQMFSFNSVTPDAFVRACHEIGQPYAVLRAGERWDSANLR
ncbi:MAG: MBL fold metallo-hydrolase [Planctomycetales bacterium]|nr:MBL fold metallo-hydrolase [Planctomycetales bacterium]